MINTNIKKQQQQTGLIQRLSNNIQLLSIGVIVSEKFCFKRCLFVVCKFALHGQQFSSQTGKRNRLKHRQFSRGVPVWRMLLAGKRSFSTFLTNYVLHNNFVIFVACAVSQILSIISCRSLNLMS